MVSQGIRCKRAIFTLNSPHYILCSNVHCESWHNGHCSFFTRSSSCLQTPSTNTSPLVRCDKMQKPNLEQKQQRQR
ncbi:hypothetical protein XENTR_v10017016 [Xenopus tropicalis]|nr:hypothetical protein XENTR_v10017016 [Xenopus tropicalis]